MGVGVVFLWIQSGRRRSGKLRSFFSNAIAPETFLRKSPPALRRVALPGRGRCVFIWCEFLAVRALHTDGTCVLAEATASKE